MFNLCSTINSSHIQHLQKNHCQCYAKFSFVFFMNHVIIIMSYYNRHLTIVANVNAQLYIPTNNLRDLCRVSHVLVTHDRDTRFIKFIIFISVNFKL